MIRLFMATIICSSGPVPVAQIYLTYKKNEQSGPTVFLHDRDGTLRGIWLKLGLVWW